MSFLDFVLTALFLAFVVFLVVGFNRQMLQKGEERRKKYENSRKRKEEK